jgi:hypothetical protein
MRSILLITLLAAGIGLAGAPGAVAAPVNGAVIKDTSIAVDTATQVGWWYHNRRRSHWRHGSRRWG